MLLLAKSSRALLLKHVPVSSSRSAASSASVLRREILPDRGNFGAFSRSFGQSIRAFGSASTPLSSSVNGASNDQQQQPQEREIHSTAGIYQNMNITDTPLGTEEGSLLLDGLDVFTVPAKEDKHPLTVYGIGDEDAEPNDEDHVLLMLHGRTWSSIPVYHLLGGPTNAAKGYESRSLMEAVHDSKKKIRVYSMDFRGFGGTPADETQSVEPNRCVEDVESVLDWLAARHGFKTPEKISLMGWSQGALVAQLTAQRPKPLFSRLILYGSIFDPMVRYPRDPLYLRNPPNVTTVENTFDDAVEDFTIAGTIPPKAATYFAEAALLADPIKAKWKHLYQFNNCDPARIHVPTLVVSEWLESQEIGFVSLYVSLPEAIPAIRLLTCCNFYGNFLAIFVILFRWWATRIRTLPSTSSKPFSRTWAGEPIEPGAFFPKPITRCTFWRAAPDSRAL